MVSAATYENILVIAKQMDHSKTLNEIESYFGYLCNNTFIDACALSLQICVKKSKPMYLHGYVVTSALKSYIDLVQLMTSHQL